MPPMDEKDPMQKMMIDNFLTGLRIFIESLRGFGDFEKYADKMELWNKEKYLSAFLDIAEPMADGFQILAHGDPWVSFVIRDSECNFLTLNFLSAQQHDVQIQRSK